MKRFTCGCGRPIYFENTKCIACGKDLGWCPACRAMTSLVPDSEGAYRCEKEACGERLVKCHNYEVERVCNRCCRPTSGSATPFCDCCRFNDTIPDLSVPGNRDKWRRLEAAKRRLFYTLDLLGLPYGGKNEGVVPALTFDFKADVPQQTAWSRNASGVERVYTGHAEGKITINIREADTVEREKSRVMFQEAHRTEVRNFRHEIAHYYWSMLIRGKRETEFKSVFGDFENPSYGVAQASYYKNGPKNGWQINYVSAYATMHPWEDFAESFATYLDMVSVLDTALQSGMAESCDPVQAELQIMVEQYKRLGVVLNEMNRAMGLMDIVTGVFAEPIVAKLRFIHELVRGVGQRASTNTLQA